MDMQIKDALKQRDQYRQQSDDKDIQIKELKARVEGASNRNADLPEYNGDEFAYDENTDNLLECIRILTKFRQGLSEKYQISQEDMLEVDNLIN